MELIRPTLIFVMICALQAKADLTSPFSSTVKGLDIPNAHLVANYSMGSSYVIRGQAPTVAQLDQLLDIGIQRVLIFKNQTKDEVVKEISDLKKKGFKSHDILQVDMPWKDISNFQNICEMTMESLRFIEESVRTKRSVYFHCTVGEDRTGYLAGLWGLWNGHYKTVNDAFSQEMCDRGYEAGDHKKPFVVVKAVRDHLTPAFMKMVTLLADSRRAGLNLKQIKCPKDIQVTRALMVCK